MTHAYMHGDTGANCWFIGTWEPVNFEAVTAEEGNALIGRCPANGFVVLMNEMMCCLWDGSKGGMENGMVFAPDTAHENAFFREFSAKLIRAFEAECRSLERAALPN